MASINSFSGRITASYQGRQSSPQITILLLPHLVWHLSNPYQKIHGTHWLSAFSLLCFPTSIYQLSLQIMLTAVLRSQRLPVLRHTAQSRSSCRPMDGRPLGKAPCDEPDDGQGLPLKQDKVGPYQYTAYKSPKIKWLTGILSPYLYFVTRGGPTLCDKTLHYLIWSIVVSGSLNKW